MADGGDEKGSWNPTASFEGSLAAEWMKNELNIKSVYIVDDKDLYGIGVANLFARKAEEIGLNIVGRASITKNDNITIEKVMNTIIKQKPDLVYFAGVANAGYTPLLKGLRAANVTAKIVGSRGIGIGSFIQKEYPAPSGRGRPSFVLI